MPSARLIIGSLLIAAMQTSMALAQTHTVQPSDIVNLKTIATPRLSPDGRMVAYSVTTPTASGKPRNQHIWLAATDHPGTARPFVYGSGSDSAPAWSPDGTHLAFLSDRPNPLAEPNSPFAFKAVPSQADKAVKPSADPDTTSDEDNKGMQLWWIPLDGGEASPLTNLPGGITAFKWSYDGKRIAFLASDPDSKADTDRKKAKNDQHRIDQDYHYQRLWIYDLGSHEAHLLTTDAQNINTLDWSPDGATILSRVSPTPRLNEFWYVSKVVLFDANTGTARQVVEEHSGFEEPLFSQDGSAISFSRLTPKGIADLHLVHTLATGEDAILEDKLKGTIAEMHWLADGHLLVNVFVAAHTEAHIVDVRTLSTVQLGGLPLTALDFDSTRDGKTIAYLGETSSQPAEVSIWRNGSTQVLTDTNPQVSQWTLGTAREVQWTNPSDHHVVYGILTLPPGYQQGKRYKTIIHVHGGPEEAFTVGFSADWYNYAALLASQGYVVLQPNYRGSAGQEIAFTEGDYQDWGGKDFADVMAGVDWLEKQGIADPDRLAIAGWSYGGFMTSWAVTHTNRFKAAMAGAAVTDAFSMSVTTDIAPTYASEYMGPLKRNDYDRFSAVRFAEACHTPVLVLHGEADVRVPLAQGQEFYHALRFLGRDTEMVTYPREPHIFEEREHQQDSLTRELAWFAKYLPNDPTP